MSSKPIVSHEDRGRILQRILFCPSEERTARELLSLEKSERQQVWADMAGYAAAIDYRMHAESPELVQNRLLLLQRELQDAGGAYSLAVEQDAAWVDRQKIKFLRAEDFNASAAAARMQRYFTLKQALFGKEKLGRDIRLQDLNQDDMDSLRAGGVQILSEPDHAGRQIFFTQTRNYVYKDRKNLLRAFFYGSQYATREEKHQKVGFLSVSYNVGGYPPGGYDFEMTRNVSQLVNAVPIRFCGIYFCFSNAAWKQVAEVISHLVSPLIRVRLRSVEGSHQECLYQLYALGIPIDTIPLNEQGENRLDYHHQWIESELELELEKGENESLGSRTMHG